MHHGLNAKPLINAIESVLSMPERLLGRDTCRLLGDGVDIRIIQLVLGHSDIKTTQRYLNITDEELRKTLTGVWERRRQLKAVGE